MEDAILAVHTQSAFGGLVVLPTLFCILVIDASGSASSSGEYFAACKLLCFCICLLTFAKLATSAIATRTSAERIRKAQDSFLQMHHVCKLHDCEMYVAPFAQHSSLMQPWSTIDACSKVLPTRRGRATGVNYKNAEKSWEHNQPPQKHSLCAMPVWRPPKLSCHFGF